jgi:hypothetical protein
MCSLVTSSNFSEEYVNTGINKVLYEKIIVFLDRTLDLNKFINP